MTSTTFIKFDPRQTHEFTYEPGSKRWAKHYNYKYYDAKGTWGEIGKRASTNRKHLSSGGYTVDYGKNTFYYKIPKKSITQRQAGQLPRGGNVMRVVGTDFSEDPIAYEGDQAYQPVQPAKYSVIGNYEQPRPDRTLNTADPIPEKNKFTRRNGYYAPQTAPTQPKPNTESTRQPIRTNTRSTLDTVRERLGRLYNFFAGSNGVPEPASASTGASTPSRYHTPSTATSPTNYTTPSSGPSNVTSSIASTTISPAPRSATNTHFNQLLNEYDNAIQERFNNLLNVYDTYYGAEGRMSQDEEEYLMRELEQLERSTGNVEPSPRDGVSDPPAVYGDMTSQRPFDITNNGLLSVRTANLNQPPPQIQSPVANTPYGINVGIPVVPPTYEETRFRDETNGIPPNYLDDELRHSLNEISSATGSRLPAADLPTRGSGRYAVSSSSSPGSGNTDSTGVQWVGADGHWIEIRSPTAYTIEDWRPAISALLNYPGIKPHVKRELERIYALNSLSADNARRLGYYYNRMRNGQSLTTSPRSTRNSTNHVSPAA